MIPNFNHSDPIQNSYSNNKNSKNNDPNFINVPDELDIVLHTSVPLLGSFYYSPSMSIRNKNLISQQNLIFNPLYKLDKNSLNNIPDYETRVSHFFNRSAFESMLFNYSAFQPMRISLNELSSNYLQFNDNINNNITFILDTIFEPGQTLFLGDEPYTILFYKVKLKKPRITNKIRSIYSDPNNAPYYIRNKLKQDGINNKKLLNKLDDNFSENIDVNSIYQNSTSTISSSLNTASNLFNNFKNKLDFFKNKNNNLQSNKVPENDANLKPNEVPNNNNLQRGGGGINNSIYFNLYNIYKDFKQIHFNLNHSTFFKNFYEFLSILINNYNSQNITSIPITYMNNAIIHGIDNIATPISIKKFFENNNTIDSLQSIANTLSFLGINLIVNNKSFINNVTTQPIIDLHFTQDNKTNNISFLNFTASKPFLSGGKRNYDYYNNYNRNRNYNYPYSREDTYNSFDRVNYNPYVSSDDFEHSSLNKYEIEVYLELTKEKLSKKDMDCIIRKNKMIYNAKQLFSIENYFDFTKSYDMSLYGSKINFNDIKPFVHDKEYEKFLNDYKKDVKDDKNKDDKNKDNKNKDDNKK